MRTLVYKLLSLVILLLGMLLYMAVFDHSGTITALLNKVPELTVPYFAEGGSVDWQRVGQVAATLLVLAGINGLFFRKLARNDKVSFRTDRGEMILALPPIQNNLEKVIRALPEVRSARVRVKPSRDRQRVQVIAEVILKDCAEQGLHKTSKLVSACVTEAVGKAVGFEDRATVQLVIKGAQVDAKAAAKRLREEVETRMDKSAPEAAVVKAPPAASPVIVEAPQVVAPVAMETPQEVVPEPVVVERPSRSFFVAEAPKEAVSAPPAADAFSFEHLPLAVATPPEKAPEDTTSGLA